MKQTKIVASVSDRRCSVEFIQQLYDAGANVIRMNTAHADAEGIKESEMCVLSRLILEYS